MAKSIQERQQDINRKIEDNFNELNGAKDEVVRLREQLESMQEERQRFTLLSEISDLLNQLEKRGGAELFWGDQFDRDETRKHLERVQKSIAVYDERYAEVQSEYYAREDLIESLAARANILNEESITLEEVAEEAQHEFVIEREMVKPDYRPLVMPWTGNVEDERRFYKITATSIVLALLLAILIPMYEVPIPDRFVPVEVPERLAQLVIEKKPPPPPPPPQEKKPDEKEPKPSKKKEEAPKKQTTTARKRAESAGLLAFKNNFSSLVNTGASNLGASARISSKGKKAKKASRSILTSQAKGGGSGGISTASLSRDVGGAGKGIEGDGVGFSRVESAIGSDFFGEERPLSEGAGPSRTDEEIQIVFDRYKSALYRIYNRELRNNPTLQGKMVLRLTIEPDGKVSACKVDSSDMESPGLNSKIVARVLKFNFGPKEGVPPLTILYPIDFLPAS